MRSGSPAKLNPDELPIGANNGDSSNRNVPYLFVVQSKECTGHE